MSRAALRAVPDLPAQPAPMFGVRVLSTDTSTEHQVPVTDLGPFLARLVNSEDGFATVEITGPSRREAR